MGRLGLIWLSLLVLQISVVHSMAKVSEEPARRGMQQEQQDEFKKPSIADRPVSSPAEATRGSEDSEGVEAPVMSIRKLAKHHSGSSVAGGEVIIGGLLTAIFAAVFCYIRVTRKRHSTDDAKGDH